MHIDQWLELKRTKVGCLVLAAVFGLQQTVSGADVNTLHAIQLSGEQQRQMEGVQRAAIVTMYDDLYGRLPTEQDLAEALAFLKKSPQLAHLVERLGESPESRWRLRQLNPERIQQRKDDAVRISQAVSRMVGDFLRHSSLEIAPNLSITPASPDLARLNEPEIQMVEQWLASPDTLCSNCAPNALAPLLSMVGVPVSRETLTAQAFLVDYLSGNLGISGQWSVASGQPKGPLFISMETVQRLAQAYGLTLHAVQLSEDELLLMQHPMIAALDLTQDGQAHH